VDFRPHRAEGAAQGAYSAQTLHMSPTDIYTYPLVFAQTARFYGPSKTTINELIAPWITKYLELIEFDRVDENPLFYLFPVSNDFSRAVSASQWGSQIKSMFKRWSGIEVTPKSLRSSYICWLKGATDAPEILQAAAKAMRHTDDTQASDRYDVEGNDRLVAASTSFTLAYASKFQPSGAPQASTSGSSPLEHPVVDEWVLIPNQPVGFTFRVAPKQPEVVDHRVFEHTLKWLEAGMTPGCQIKFSTFVGRASGLVITLPDDESVIGQPLTVRANVPQSATKAVMFRASGLMRKQTDEEMAAALAALETEEGSKIDADKMKQWWEVNGGLQILDIDPETWAVEVSSRLAKARELNAKFLENFQTDIVHIPNETLRTFRDGHYLLEFKKTLRSNADAGGGVEATVMDEVARIDTKRINKEGGTRASVPSQVQPPIADAQAHLAEFNLVLGASAPNGDCFILSVLCACGEISPEEAVHPTVQVTERVRRIRNVAIDLIAGDSPIGTIDASVFRFGEKLPADSVGSQIAMAAWRVPGHWKIEGEEYKSSIFQFGVSQALEREIVVLENGDDGHLNPASCYGLLDPGGGLFKNAGRGSSPATIESFKSVPFVTVLEMLRSPHPPLLLEFDGVNHFSPFVTHPPVTDAEIEAKFAELGCHWKDGGKLAIVGNAVTYEKIDELSEFLDKRLNVDAMAVMTPEGRYDLERSRYGNRCLVVASSMDGAVDEDLFGDGGGVEVSSNANGKRPVAVVTKKPKPSPKELKGAPRARPNLHPGGLTIKKPAVAKSTVAVTKSATANKGRCRQARCYTDQDITAQETAEKYGSSFDWKFFTSNAPQFPPPEPVIATDIAVGRAFILPRDYPPYANFLIGEGVDFVGWMGMQMVNS